MTRSLKKGPYVDEKLENRLVIMSGSKKKKILNQNRKPSFGFQMIKEDQRKSQNLEAESEKMEEIYRHPRKSKNKKRKSKKMKLLKRKSQKFHTF